MEIATENTLIQNFKQDTENEATIYCDVCLEVFSLESDLHAHLREWHPLFLTTIKLENQSDSLMDSTYENFEDTKENIKLVLPTGEESLISHINECLEVTIVQQPEVNRRKDVADETKCETIDITCEEVETEELTCKFCHKPRFQNAQANNNLKAFFCSNCNAPFMEKFNFTTHLRNNNAEKPFSCKSCQAKFSSQAKLKAHLQKLHPLICYVCHKTFDSKRNIKNHLKEHNVNTRKKRAKYHPTPNFYACNKCPEKFSGETSFLRHINKHSIEKETLCKMCGTNMPVQALKKHMIEHVGDKSFHLVFANCFVSGTFDDSTPLPMSCSICKRTFKNNSKLKQHMTQHVGDRNFMSVFANTLLKFED